MTANTNKLRRNCNKYQQNTNKIAATNKELENCSHKAALVNLDSLRNGLQERPRISLQQRVAHNQDSNKMDDAKGLKKRPPQEDAFVYSLIWIFHTKTLFW